MRRLLIGFCILVCAYSRISAQVSPSDAVQQAEAAYLQGDYTTAIVLYEALITSGVREASIYFNLGNAYYQAGKLGQALLNYHRAQRREPRYAPVYDNIALVRAVRVDVQPDDADLMADLAVVTEKLLTLQELGWAIFALWMLWFGLAAEAVLRRSRQFRGVLIAVGIILLLGLGIFSIRSYVVYQRPLAVVVDFSAQVMSGPDNGYLPLYELYSAAEMRLLEEEGDWVRFVLPDGRQGWINQSALAVVD